MFSTYLVKKPFDQGNTHAAGERETPHPSMVKGPRGAQGNRPLRSKTPSLSRLGTLLSFHILLTPMCKNKKMYILMSVIKSRNYLMGLMALSSEQQAES